MNTDDDGAGAELGWRRHDAGNDRVAGIWGALRMVVLIQRHSYQKKIIMSTCMKFQFGNIAERCLFADQPPCECESSPPPPCCAPAATSTTNNCRNSCSTICSGWPEQLLAADASTPLTAVRTRTDSDSAPWQSCWPPAAHSHRNCHPTKRPQ